LSRGSALYDRAADVGELPVRSCLCYVAIQPPARPTALRRPRSPRDLHDSLARNVFHVDSDTPKIPSTHRRGVMAMHRSCLGDPSARLAGPGASSGSVTRSAGSGACRRGSGAGGRAGIPKPIRRTPVAPAIDLCCNLRWWEGKQGRRGPTLRCTLLGIESTKDELLVRIRLGRDSARIATWTFAAVGGSLLAMSARISSIPPSARRALGSRPDRRL